LQQLKLRAGENEIRHRSVEIELRTGQGFDQRRFALDVALLQIDALLGKLQQDDTLERRLS
jgi:hypothetical protein